MQLGSFEARLGGQHETLDCDKLLDGVVVGAEVSACCGAGVGRTGTDERSFDHHRQLAQTVDCPNRVAEADEVMHDADLEVQHAVLAAGLGNLSDQATGACEVTPAGEQPGSCPFPGGQRRGQRAVGGVGFAQRRGGGLRVAQEEMGLGDSHPGPHSCCLLTDMVGALRRSSEVLDGIVTVTGITLDLTEHDVEPHDRGFGAGSLSAQPCVVGEDPCLLVATAVAEGVRFVDDVDRPASARQQLRQLLVCVGTERGGDGIAELARH